MTLREAYAERDLETAARAANYDRLRRELGEMIVEAAKNLHTSQGSARGTMSARRPPR